MSISFWGPALRMSASGSRDFKYASKQWTDKQTETHKQTYWNSDCNTLHPAGDVDRDRTNRPLLFRDQISNCTNLFRPKPNRTTHADPRSLPWIIHATDQRCADPEMLRPHQSANSDHRSASPSPTPHTGSQPQPCVQSIWARQAGSLKNN